MSLRKVTIICIPADTAHELRCINTRSWYKWNIAWDRGKVHTVEAKCVTLVVGSYIVNLISSKKQIEIRGNRGRLCGFENR